MGNGDLGHQPAVERRLALSGAAAFARAIAARHRPGRTAAPGVPRVGLRPAVLPARTPPIRLDLRVTHRLERVVTRLRTTTAPPLLRVSPARPGPAGLRVVERITTRCTRADGATGGPRPAPGIRSAAPAVARVPVMAATDFAASPAPVRRVVRSTGSAAAPAVAAPPAPARPVAPQPAVLDVAELDRVTSHVVATLDRRVNAWRERTGRV